MFNVTLTNIATSKEPVFICGARIDEFYPMMMQALNMGPVGAVITYAGKAHFSFTANRDLVPDAQRLADGLLEELEILRKAASEHTAAHGPHQGARAAAVRSTTTGSP